MAALAGATGLLAVLPVTPSARANEPSASFAHDVMAVLSKAGCNMGACHGNQNGKGGFKLSLRGEDPHFDWLALTRDQHGRRINLVDPESSLLLQKPSQQVAHEGGRRFAIDSLEYGILRNWIAGGAVWDASTAPELLSLEATPAEQIVTGQDENVQLSVIARFADGSLRDVTRLAVYEPSSNLLSVDPDGVITRERFGEATVLVRFLTQQQPVRIAFVPEGPYAWEGPSEANQVDALVFAKLRSLHLQPAGVCDDATFLRRAFVDALGILPTADEARRFAADDRPDKRARWIDELLERPEFAKHWALKWCDLLHGEEKTLDRKGVQALHHWLERSLARGKPLDELARDVLSARGSTYENPPANFYRASRDKLARAESIAQVFLGVRLQCARCHNHPFDRWTQDDYYQWAAVFSGIDYKIVDNRRKDTNDKHEFDGEQIVFSRPRSKLENPRTGKNAKPRLLGCDETLDGRPDDSLEQAADWIAGGDNPFFAAAQANRIWYHLAARGIVEPVDDFRATNPASNPALLDMLAGELVESRYDLRHLVRMIMNSHTYQLECGDEQENETAAANFAQAAVRRLPAETLLDAICQVLDTPARFNGYPVGIRAGELPGVQAVRPRDKRVSDGDRFLTLFGKPPRLLTCECERMQETTLGQTFQLLSGSLINDLLTEPDNRLGQWLSAAMTPDDLVDELYWTALGRAPTDAERQAILPRFEAAADRRALLEDVAWSLLTSREFLLRH